MFFDRFQKMCDLRDVKMTPLLQKLNIGTGNLHKWRNGAMPTGGTLIKLCKALDCTADYLLELTENPFTEKKIAPSEDGTILEYTIEVEAPPLTSDEIAKLRLLLDDPSRILKE